MYLPEHFEETDPVEIARVIAQAPLVSLVVHTQEGLVANPVPVLMEEGRLIGHIAAANDLHRIAEDGAAALAIAHGESSYVSPNWYPSKAEHHRHVPTWNYQTVQIHGALHFSHEVKTKRAVVGKLTARFERETNGRAAWRMSDAPRDYMETMLDSIVAFRLDITRVLAKSKLSQNREAGDHDAVRAQMEARGADDLARAMARPAKP